MADGGQDFNLGHVVGSAGEKGDDGSTVWNTSTAPTYANSKYTFNISNLSGKTGLQIAVNDIIFYSTYYYIVSAVNTTTVDCSTRVSIKGSDASVTIQTSWGSTTSDSKVPSEKLTKDTLDTKIAKSSTTGLMKNDGTVMTSGTGSGNYSAGNHTHSTYISKSSTSGLVKNDGTIDTSAYITSSALSNYMQKSSTSGLMKNDGTVDTNSYLTTGTASSTYQPKLTSGTNIKTINNESLLGSGNITIQGGSSVDVVTSWEATLSDSKVPSEKLVKNTIDGLSIPTKTSDLTNDGDGTNVFVKNNDSRLTDSRTPTSHTHGNLTNDGKVGSNANYIVVTGTGGAITSVQKLGNITYDGKIGSTSGKPVITTTSGTVTTGSFGTSSGTFAEGNHTHSGYISTSSTTGLIKNDGSIMTSGTGSTNYAAGNHTHSGYVSATKVTSWSSTVSDSNVPSEKLVKDYIDDQIGTAIQYIQQ